MARLSRVFISRAAMADSVDQTSKLMTTMPIGSTLHHNTTKPNIANFPLQIQRNQADCRQGIAGPNFTQNEAVAFIGCLGACVLNIPRDIYNDNIIVLL